MDEAGENAVGSSQQRRAYQTARTSVAALVWEHSREMLALLPNKTLASLPNLFHVENAMSTYHRKHLTETEARSADYNSIDFLDLYEKPEEAQTLALLKGVRGIQSLGIDSLTAETITSWKLREAVAFDGFTMNPPEHLQHLDLEIRILGLGPISPLATALGWRGMLETLSELKSLRLAFACGGGRYADEENSDGHSWMDSDTFYIDYLLIDPCDSDSDSAGLVFFPRLRSLRLVNCALRVQGLQTIAMRHSATLKELELSRVTFDPLYCVGSWSEIGAMCHEALPNLTRLRLAKLITYLPTPRLEGEPEKSPVPNSWNRGLEGATSYEWIKNGRGSGADLEIIGPRCPWHK